MEVAFRRLLGRGFAVAADAPRDDDATLRPDEKAYIGGAVAHRRAEFAGARRCARTALAHLGVVAGSLVPHADRSPRWPEGVKGSLTHIASCCAAAVTRLEAITGVGIDLEAGDALDAALLDRVCTPAERVWLATLPPPWRGTVAKLFFSAKEAVYKCQYPSTGRALDFLDLDLALDLEGGRFRVSGSSMALPLDWRRLRGRYAEGGGLILASAVIARGSA